MSVFSLLPIRWRGRLLLAGRPLGLLGSLPAQARFQVTGRPPARHAVAAARTTNVALTFHQCTRPRPASCACSAPSAAEQLVRGGNATAAGSTLTVAPATDLRAGETVRVTVPATVTSTGGTAAVPHTYQFTAGVSATAAGIFGGTPNVGGAIAVSYHHLRSAVQSAPMSDLATTGCVPKVNPASNNLPYVPPSASQMPTVFGFDETRGGLTPAFQGFFTGYFSPATLGTVLTSGNVNVPLTVAPPLTANNKAGWALLGNAYAQPIDWDLRTTPAGLDASVFVWYSTGGTTGAYRNGNGSGVGNREDGLIGLGQAFFVRATSATTGPFTNALRVEANVGRGRAAAAGSAHQRPLLTPDAGQRNRRRVLGTCTGTSQLAARSCSYWPNPASAGTVRLTLSGSLDAAALVTEHHAAGRVVLRATPDTSGTLDVRGLSAGVYAVRCAGATARLVAE
ncbi:MAG: Ig-like domain-containing protein [Hymenobacteraceae bacterium]|nr:Ig-like domain-containing protein [Hymenobacteraceae bacterium]